jgi:serine/threonine protein kinase
MLYGGCQDEAAMAEFEEFKAQAQVEEQNKEKVYLAFEKMWNEGKLDVADEVFAPNHTLHFRKESNTVGPAALDHPNICTVYEFDEAEEKTFISMAYVEGQSLRKKLESGPLELDEALRNALQVAQGLQIAHKKGVVHRDIKSANIMVTEDNQAKIMDFGLARMTGGTLLTQEGTAMGTIAYMSPEQARGE